jgi:hypothetical protein
MGFNSPHPNQSIAFTRYYILNGRFVRQPFISRSSASDSTRPRNVVGGFRAISPSSFLREHLSPLVRDPQPRDAHLLRGRHHALDRRRHEAERRQLADQPQLETMRDHQRGLRHAVGAARSNSSARRRAEAGRFGVGGMGNGRIPARPAASRDACRASAVRFAPLCGLRSDIWRRPSRATTGLMHRSKYCRFIRAVRRREARMFLGL